MSHPQSFAISDAAAYVAIMDVDPLMSEPAKTAALHTFALLVGMPKAEALAYAHAINAADVRAALLPF